MGIEVAPLGSTNFNAAQARGPKGAQPVAARDAAELSPDEIPALPPQEVLDAVDAAGRVARELHATGRELRFEPDPDGGRVRVEVRDLDGNVLRTVPPSEALDIATGGPLD